MRALTKGPNTTFNYMSVKTAEKIGADMWAAGWNPRVEFAMHGEPTANPELPEIVAAVRASLPKSYFMLTTNGMPLIESGDQGHFEALVEDLFEAGIDTIALDAYRGLKVHEYARRMERLWMRVGDYPKDGNDFNPHRRKKASDPKIFSILKDISDNEDGTHGHLSNQGGTAGPKDYSMNGIRCALPFREMSVRWDGNVAICCNDWRGVYKIGNVLERSMESLWHDPAMYAARKKLYQGERDFGACDGCTHRTYRPGLLPDRMGKETLPPASQDDLDLIAMALEGQPYTPGLLRVWERKEGRPQPGVLNGHVRMIDADGKAVVKKKVA